MTFRLQSSPRPYVIHYPFPSPRFSRFAPGGHSWLTSPAGVADAAPVHRITSLAVLLDTGTAQLAAQAGGELVTPLVTQLAPVAGRARALAWWRRERERGRISAYPTGTIGDGERMSLFGWFKERFSGKVC